MQQPPLTYDQDLAVYIVKQIGPSLLDAFGNPNIAVIKALFEFNEVPPELQPVLFKNILTVCDELRQAEDGQ
jgi:hypothetical protein